MWRFRIFRKKLSKVGTQPIVGSQINLKAHDIVGKVTLYAKTEKGYKNLTKLSSLSLLIVRRQKSHLVKLKE